MYAEKYIPGSLNPKNALIFCGYLNFKELKSVLF